MLRPLRSFAVCVVAAFAFSACSDSPPTSVNSGTTPSFTISDGAHGGNAHFYWLQPLSPTNPSFTGKFDPNLYPTLEICRDTVQTTVGHCNDLLASFKRDGGF